jgi:hypothetical protein
LDFLLLACHLDVTCFGRFGAGFAFKMTVMTSLRFNDTPAAHDPESHFVMPGAVGVISSFFG